jgi:hypothetical protein
MLDRESCSGDWHALTFTYNDPGGHAVLVGMSELRAHHCASEILQLIHVPVSIMHLDDYSAHISFKNLMNFRAVEPSRDFLHQLFI